MSGLAGLRKLRGFLTTMQKSAAGIVGQVSLKAQTVSKSESNGVVSRMCF